MTWCASSLSYAQRAACVNVLLLLFVSHMGRLGRDGGEFNGERSNEEDGENVGGKGALKCSAVLWWKRVQSRLKHLVARENTT